MLLGLFGIKQLFPSFARQPPGLLFTRSLTRTKPPRVAASQCHRWVECLSGVSLSCRQFLVLYFFSLAGLGLFALFSTPSIWTVLGVPKVLRLLVSLSKIGFLYR